VPGEFYFMAIGGLGVTLAGFAGLIAALERREGGHSPVAAWRIRNVVYSGFGVTFVGFATVALYTITQNVTLTVRLATIVMLLTVAANWRSLLPSAALRSQRQRRVAIVMRLAVGAAALVNIALASVGYLQLLLLILLFGPIGIFVLAVADVTRGDAPPATQEESKR
jgi:hypothetical protein